MKIIIENLTFETIVGILDFEREEPQKVIITSTIDYTFEETQFINYADVALHIEREMQREKFLLLEDALLSLSKSLKESFPTINILSLKISKPNILQNCTVSLQEIFKF